MIATRHFTVRFSTADDEIATLYDLGWPVIPCCAPVANSPNGCTGKSKAHSPRCSSPGKVPLVAGFQHYAAALPTLNRILCDHGEFGLRHHGDANRAVVVPAGHVVVEADTEAADAELRILLDGIVTPMRAPRPGRGHAWLLRLPSGVDVQSSNHVGETGAWDVKGPGSIVVIPDSVHVSGHRYAWVEHRAPWGVAIAEAPAALVELLREASADARARPSTRRQDEEIEDDELAGQADAEGGVGEIKGSDNTPRLLAPSDPTGPAVQSLVGAGADATDGEACCPIVLPPPNHHQSTVTPLITKLDSTARKIATDGYKDPTAGGSFKSRSEMRLALALAALYAGGTRPAIKRLLLGASNAFRKDDHRDSKAVVDLDIDEAENCYFDEVDRAIRVRFFAAYLSRTKTGRRDVAQVRATLCLGPSDGSDQIQHTVNIRLGDPAWNEIGGEWFEALRALPDEPLLERAEELLEKQERSAWSRGEIFDKLTVPGRRTECLYVIGKNETRHLLPLDAGKKE